MSDNLRGRTLGNIKAQRAVLEAATTGRWREDGEFVIVFGFDPVCDCDGDNCVDDARAIALAHNTQAAHLDLVEALANNKAINYAGSGEWIIRILESWNAAVDAVQS